MELLSGADPTAALECYRGLASAVGEGLYRLDAEGRFVAVDDAFVETSGYERADLVGEHVSMVVGDTDAGRIEGEIHRHLAGEDATVGPLEVTFETAGGGRTPFEVHVTPLQDCDEFRGTVGVVRDVSDRVERERAERELRKSEERFRTMMERSPFSIQLFDAEGRTITANPAWERLWDASRDELDDYNLLADEQLEAAGLLSYIRDAYAGDVVELPVVHYDPAEIGKPGRDRWIEGYVYPLFPDDDETTEVVVVHHDVTERKEREQELERYEMAVETVWDGITILDSDDRFVLVNDAFCELTGYDREDVVGEHATLILDESTYDLAGEHYDEVIVGDLDTATLEYDLLTADGGTVPVEARFGPVEYADGSVGGAGVVRDITERRERERERQELIDRLAESNERLEQFAYAASHDLQEPLRMVTSYLQLIERRYGDDLAEDGREFLAFATDGADRMRDMIEGLLAYSRIDTRGDPLESVDLDDVLADVRDDLRMKIDETDAEITADDLPTVLGDRGQLRQLFQNLLDNAVEYSGDSPPRVDVGVERDDDGWVFRVADDGIGFDPDHDDRIFEVFQRLHTNEEYAGTGIGLALCQRIVERHGGDIWVDSAPGEGSTFSFTLPDVEDG